MLSVRRKFLLCYHKQLFDEKRNAWNDTLEWSPRTEFRDHPELAIRSGREYSWCHGVRLSVKLLFIHYNYRRDGSNKSSKYQNVNKYYLLALVCFGLLPGLNLILKFNTKFIRLLTQFIFASNMRQEFVEPDKLGYTIYSEM